MKEIKEYGEDFEKRVRIVATKLIEGIIKSLQAQGVKEDIILKMVLDCTKTIEELDKTTKLDNHH